MLRRFRCVQIFLKQNKDKKHHNKATDLLGILCEVSDRRLENWNKPTDLLGILCEVSDRRLENWLLLFKHIQRIGCQPEKTTIHGGLSRSWAAEQGEKKKKKSGSVPLPSPHAARY